MYELFNFEAEKNTKNQSKYSLDKSIVFYSMLTRSKRKIKCIYGTRDDTALNTCMLWKLRRSFTTGIINLSWLIGFWTLSFMSYSHNQMFGIWRPQAGLRRRIEAFGIFKAYEGDVQDGFIIKAPFVQNLQGFN
jgi:hypothetical protein